jgi:hypothetical protein
MKKFAYAILAIVVGSVLVTSSALAAAEKSDAAPAAAAGKKITQNEAQHLVLKKYPGARVVSSEEKTMNGNAVWVVTFMQTGANTAQKVSVDESTGKLTRM